MVSLIHRLPGLVLTDHRFTLPLDHSRPAGKQITIFAREVVAPDKEQETLPWLIFLQGGPGFGSPRPLSRSGWLNKALQSYRVLLLDQRGTGQSTPVTLKTLARFPSARAQADYLKHFRADSIVRDAEQIRHLLVGEAEPWSVLGQSYGGFCLTHYLSAAPDGLREALFCGGLPPLDHSADDVYRATYRRVIDKNKLYYERYPNDIERVRDIVDYLVRTEVRLPGGARLSPRRFQQLGINFGASDGFERLHYLLEEAFVNGVSGRELSFAFLRSVENWVTFETNPIFAILHEAIYCQQNASNWAAERIRAEYEAFRITADKPVSFTGEMIYPWMFDEYKYLEPLKETADILANYDGWPRLYDRDTLLANSVPGAAAIYYNDMYVERTFSEETAKSIPGIKIWVTSEYEHNGLRAHGKTVLGRLLNMIKGEI